MKKLFIDTITLKVRWYNYCSSEGGQMPVHEFYWETQMLKPVWRRLICLPREQDFQAGLILCYLEKQVYNSRLPSGGYFKRRDMHFNLLEHSKILSK